MPHTSEAGDGLACRCRRASRIYSMCHARAFTIREPGIASFGLLKREIYIEVMPTRIISILQHGADLKMKSPGQNPDRLGLGKRDQSHLAGADESEIARGATPRRFADRHPILARLMEMGS